MAWDSSTVLELRAEGSATNGGGFADLDPGTSVDYSQQDSAQLSVSDIATDGAGTGVSSATGGFTAAMVGNLIYIGGGAGLTAGFYQVTAYTDTNNITIDRSAGASGSGGDGNLGGAWEPGSSLDDEFYDKVEAGNTIWIKSGTYNASETATISSGSKSSRIHVRGYNATRGDDCFGSDRPTYNLVTYRLTIGTYTDFENVRFTTTSNYVALGNYSTIYNCRFADAGSSFQGTYLSLGTRVRVGSCEFVASDHGTSNTMVTLGSNWASFHSCYWCGSSKTNGVGVNGYNANITFDFCIFDSVYQGIETGPATTFGAFQSIFYNCGEGAYMDVEYSFGFTNCVFQGNTHGLRGSASGEGTVTKYCIFYNNTTDITNGVLDHTDLEEDPKLTDPANQDFTFATDSPLIEAGHSLANIEGL